MKKSIFLVLLILLAACSTGQMPVEYKDLTSKQAMDALADMPELRVLDIRTVPEFEAGHIKGALNVDYYEASFRQGLDQLDKDATYLVYCRSGNRSAQSMAIFSELGFKKILHMKNGVKDWAARGLPMVR